MLLGQHCDQAAHSVRDQSCARAQIGEVFWALGFATAVHIKPIIGNGDLGSSK